MELCATLSNMSYLLDFHGFNASSDHDVQLFSCQNKNITKIREMMMMMISKAPIEQHIFFPLERS